MHLLDMKETNRPDIASFLEQHLETNLHKKEPSDNLDELGGTQIEGEGDMANVGVMGVGSNKLGSFHSCPAINYNRDEESRATLELVDIFSGNALATASCKSKGK